MATFSDIVAVIVWVLLGFVLGLGFGCDINGMVLIPNYNPANNIAENLPYYQLYTRTLHCSRALRCRCGALWGTECKYYSD